MAASSTSEGGRALRWVARAGAYGVSRGSLSGSFTLSEPTKEAHDSEVRPSSADAGGVPGAASPHQCPAPRATTRPSPRSLQSTQNSGSFAMSSGRDSPLSGRCKVLPRAITRSSLAWDRRRGATCALEVIRQIIHAPARDERRTCGPYQKGTRCGVVKDSGPMNWAAWGEGWPSRLIAGEGSNRRGYRVRAAFVIPGVDSDGTQGR